MVPCRHSSGGRNRLCNVAVEASHASFGVCVGGRPTLRRNLGGVASSERCSNFGEWCVRVASGVFLASDNNLDCHCYRQWILLRSIRKGPLSELIGSSEWERHSDATNSFHEKAG